MSTDALKTSVEPVDLNTVALTVTVPPEAVEQAINQAYAKLAKSVKIPGFRKGKIPRPVLDTHVGRDYVLGEAQEELFNTVYPQAVRAEKLSAIAHPEVDEIADLVQGEPFVFTAKVPVKPELTVSSIEGISVKVPPAEASERELDAQIEHLRERFASLEPVEDRGVADSDYVLISFTGTVDGATYEGNSVDKYLYEMSKGLMPSEFDAGLLGLKAGETTRIEFEVPDTSSNPDFVGKTAAFDVEVHEIKAKVLPLIDDEFAESAGGFESMEAMRSDIKMRLDEAKAAGRERVLERNVRTEIAKRLEGEAPQAMVDSKRDSMLKEFVEGLEQRGMTLEQYAEATGFEMERIAGDISKQAEVLVREELALEALFRAAGLEITEDDVEQEYLRFAEVGEVAVEELKERWADTMAAEVIAETLTRRKAVEWLTDPANVEIVESDPSDGSDGAEDDESDETQ
ncbi:MAG: trigger factor [Clostridiales bacterium]|nr:trigger factor [Clostridiales bacterium]